MFKNFHNSLKSLEYQYSIHNSLLHLLSNFQDAITPQNIAKIDNKRTFQRTLTHFIFPTNVRNNYAQDLSICFCMVSDPKKVSKLTSAGF